MPNTKSLKSSCAAVWPEGVIARYLTVGGATVDITASVTEDTPYVHDYGNGVTGRPQGCINLTLTTECTGCKENEEAEYEGLFATALGRVLESHYGRTAQRWAQSHAEKCRAMPRPEA
ncbi:hypothetical protein EYS09_22195 [Streptomyces kasugaensis]|uniref:Uncharacterized protein n=1 Tax=Streptomyces kasugaensis TaxID=1946 RepID=A0A4Q9HRX5_STRKA|nr:hypothetical protein [Streptomyces kasugaensis]TBO57525.1 hypothetical protein EYS09_22195 [Streptomyces kasugaensis]